jgi:hypothetical protein
MANSISYFTGGSADLIAIVRPFGFNDVRPRPSMPDKAPTQPPEGPNLVTWGSPGNDIFAVRANLKSEIPKPDWDETERKYDTVRVYNKDDREQYVDTEVMTEFNMRNKIGKDRFTIRFGETQADENSEIIKKGSVRKSSTST